MFSSVIRGFLELQFHKRRGLGFLGKILGFSKADELRRSIEQFDWKFVDKTITNSKLVFANSVHDAFTYVMKLNGMAFTVHSNNTVDYLYYHPTCLIVLEPDEEAEFLVDALHPRNRRAIKFDPLTELWIEESQTVCEHGLKLFIASQNSKLHPLLIAIAYHDVIEELRKWGY